MRRFQLIRDHDVSGVSGTGLVAEGVRFTDGTVAMRWCSEGNPSSTVIWATLDDALTIHGHGGSTYLYWLDEQQP